MEKLVSTWANGMTLPENYVFPPGKRPGEQTVPTSHNIPVIDLSNKDGSSQSEIVQHIVEAARNYGFFQVINHGVPRTLMDDTRNVLREFFELPAKEKARFCSMDVRDNFILYTSGIDYDAELIHHWRDAARFNCTPVQDCMLDWPLNPPNYREVVGDYVVSVRELGSKLLEMIGEGLGLAQGYLEEMSQEPALVANHYPACPDPSLTLGAGKHCDPNLITILLQDDVPGLQVFENGQWIGVEPMPDAFVVNVGHLLNIVSNGVLRSVEHRVVTNRTRARTTAAFFIGPRKECLVEPAQAIVGSKNPPLYKRVRYGDLVQSVRAVFTGEIDCALKVYTVKA